MNPVAGSASDIAAICGMLARLPGVRVSLTTAEGDAEAIAHEALENGFDRFVAAGGDGTVNAILNGIAEGLGRVELGILPLGTGNDLAASLAVRSSLEVAVEALARWDARAVDVVRVRATAPAGADGAGSTRERLMLNGSAGGFVQAVGHATDQQSKRGILGSLSYVLTAAASLPDMEEYDLVVRTQSDERRARVIASIVCNGRTIGGGAAVNPGGMLDDGVLEAMAIPAVGIGALAVLGMKMVAGEHTDDPSLLLVRGPRIRLESDPPMPVNADGEEVGVTPAEYTALPRALRVVVGPGAAVSREGPPAAGALNFRSAGA